MPPPGPASTCTTTRPMSTHWPTPCLRLQTSSWCDRHAFEHHPTGELTSMPGLEDLYREIILDHYRNPRNRGELPVPPAHRSEGFNPLCGDEISLFIDVEDGAVTDVRIAAQGCSISQSSASMMSVAIKGKPLDEVRDLARQFKAMMTIHESS